MVGLLADFDRQVQSHKACVVQPGSILDSGSSRHIHSRVNILDADGKLMPRNVPRFQHWDDVPFSSGGEVGSKDSLSSSIGDIFKKKTSSPIKPFSHRCMSAKEDATLAHECHMLTPTPSKGMEGKVSCEPCKLRFADESIMDVGASLP